MDSSVSLAPLKLVVDLNTEGEPLEEYVAVTADELADQVARAAAAIKAETEEAAAASARADAIKALRAGIATPAQIQAAVAECLDSL